MKAREPAKTRALWVKFSRPSNFSEKIFIENLHHPEHLKFYAKGRASDEATASSVCGEDLFCQILQHKENQYSTYENSHCNIEKYRRYFSRFGYKFHSDLSEDRRNRKWVIEFWMIDIDRTECYLNTDSSHRSISCLQKWKTQYYTKFLKFTQYYLKLVKFNQYYLKLVNSGGTHHPYPPP